MKKVTLIFPGQGSQYVGMGNHPSLLEAFDKANEVLGYDLKKLCFEGPEEDLKLTQNTQPAIVTHSVALYNKLKPILESKGYQVERVLGHSVGEYSALVAAGALKLEDAVKAVHNRGKFMQEAVKVGEGKMYAVLRAPEELVVQTCEEVSTDLSSVMPANFNDPTQIVISGHAAACDQVVERLQANEEHRVRCVELPVSAPFHCSLMKPAAQRLESFLSEIEFNNLKTPYIANIDAKEYSIDTAPETIRQNLVTQVCASVLWTQSLKDLSSDTLFIEVGPGKVLKGLMRRINKEFKTLNLDSEDGFEQLETFLP